MFRRAIRRSEPRVTTAATNWPLREIAGAATKRDPSGGGISNVSGRGELAEGARPPNCEPAHTPSPAVTTHAASHPIVVACDRRRTRASTDDVAPATDPFAPPPAVTSVSAKPRSAAD